MSALNHRKLIGKALDLVGLKRWALIGLYLAKLAVGGIVFIFKGRTPAFAYQSMIGLFCETGGKSNDLISACLSRFQPRYQLSKTSGVLGTLSETKLSSIIADLDEKGFHVFDARLSDGLCDRLLEFGLSHPAKVRPFSIEDGKLSLSIDAQYDRAKPLGVRYDFSAEDLVANVDIQGLLADTSLLAVAQGYLRTSPVLDLVAMWWHTAFLKAPDKEAAQFYHFDMDRLKWLKFFFYITDVGTENGPHCFVSGSQRVGGIPQKLLRKGYARLDDSEVQSHFSSERFIEFAAPKGTIIAEDTRGLHKGKHVVTGDRLVFQLEFTNSLFGTSYPSIRLPRVENSDLRQKMQMFPRTYSTIKFAVSK